MATISAIAEAAELLQAANIDGVDNVYSRMIPVDDNDASKTVILITEVIDQEPNRFGSDKTTEFESVIALNIFYGLFTTASSDAVERAIFNAFESAGWTQVYAPGHTTDPDTKQLTKVMQFKQSKERF